MSMDVRQRTRLMAAEKDVLGYHCIARHLLNSNFKFPKSADSEGKLRPIDAREFLKYAIKEITEAKRLRPSRSVMSYIVQARLDEDVEELLLHPKHRARYLEYKASIAHVREQLDGWGPLEKDARKVYTLATKYTPRNIATLLLPCTTDLHVQRIASHYVVLQQALERENLTQMMPMRVTLNVNRADELHFGDFIIHVKSL